MNQGKLEVIKQEMTRVNVGILGISKLKCIGMGEFNSDDHCVYYCVQESLRRNAVAIILNKWHVEEDKLPEQLEMFWFILVNMAG